MILGPLSLQKVSSDCLYAVCQARLVRNGGFKETGNVTDLAFDRIGQKRAAVSGNLIAPKEMASFLSLHGILKLLSVQSDKVSKEASPIVSCSW